MLLEAGKPLCDAWGKYECFGVVKSFEYAQCYHGAYCRPYSPYIRKLWSRNVRADLPYHFLIRKNPLCNYW